MQSPTTIINHIFKEYLVTCKILTSKLGYKMLYTLIQILLLYTDTCKHKQTQEKTISNYIKMLTWVKYQSWMLVDLNFLLYTFLHFP